MKYKELLDKFKETKPEFFAEGKGKETRVLLDAWNTLLANEVQAGNPIVIKGLGNLQLVDKPATTTIDPETGMDKEIPARKVGKFKPAKVLLEA